MGVLAVIPARAGSKRVPGKNAKEIAGRPLIAWTIEASRGASRVDRTIVSTEDLKLAEIAKKYHADVPFIRPHELADDNSSSIDTVLHAVSMVTGFDWVLLLQPTSPLRTSSDIDALVDFCLERGLTSAVSVTPSREPLKWTYQIDKERPPFLVPHNASTVCNLGDDSRFVLNGAMYLSRIDRLLADRSFVGPETGGFIMPNERSVDIDYSYDWDLAEFLLRRRDDTESFSDGG